MLENLKSLNIHQYDAEIIDIRIEETTKCTISFFQKEFRSFNEEKNIGAFIRIYAHQKWYYASTTEVNNLEKEIYKLLKLANLSVDKQNRDIQIKETIIDNLQNDDYTYKLSKEDKINYINTVRSIIESEPMLINPYVTWTDNVLQKYYINNKGVAYSYNKAYSGLLDSYTLKENENIFDTYHVKCFQYKSEIDNIKEEFTRDLTEAKLFINAPVVEAGKYPVVFSPQATGIFTHESFGHKSEADFMLGDPEMKKQWEIGKRVATDIVSIIDTGLNANDSGYCPIDDDGNPAQITYLIKNGILTGRLHSSETANIMEENTTGNARAVNFNFEPIVRMTNTYIEKGDLKLEELLKPIEFGYFIKNVTHGSGHSTFTMAVNRAFKIENGKITDPVKMNVTSGSVFETLHNIDGIGDEIEIVNQAFGGCGKGEQFPLHVSFGGPYIRLKSYNVS